VHDGMTHVLDAIAEVLLDIANESRMGDFSRALDEIAKVMSDIAEAAWRAFGHAPKSTRTPGSVGVDMNRFPTDRHLASWAGLCHGHHESAGKQKSGKMRKGNAWLRGALIEAALGATRAKKSALAARYRRVMRHRGTQESRRRRRACLARDRLSSACPPDDLP